MSKTFCPIPWNFQAVRSNGDLRICCQANISQNQGILRHRNGQPYNAKSDQLSDSRNSDLMRQVRQKILNGEWDETCTRCQQEEANGLNSRREYENERWSLTFKEAQNVTQSDGSIDTQSNPVVYYDLRFGNLCNLKCRMCGPTDSSAWYEDWTKLHGSNEFKDTSGAVKIINDKGQFKTNAYDWHYSETFWKQIEKNLGSIQHVYMAGGEPLLIKRHYDFLQKCVDKKIAKNIVLEYNTNLTKLPKKILDLWSHFKQVYVGASIDGFGDVLEYQRHPAKWDQIYENLKLLNNQPSNVLSWFAFTVTAYNVFHLIDFMKWKLLDSGLNNINRTKRRPILTPHVAHNPKHLNIRVLPDPLKEKVIADFNQFEKWITSENFPQETIDQGLLISSSIKKYIIGSDYYTKHWAEFCRQTKTLDSIRGENILKICPQYGNYLI